MRLIAAETASFDQPLLERIGGNGAGLKPAASSRAANSRAAAVRSKRSSAPRRCAARAAVGIWTGDAGRTLGDREEGEGRAKGAASHARVACAGVLHGARPNYSRAVRR